jgi:glyoxylase-like metal-dependent hydrolase (beta-lactamase superfamily II)
MGGLHRTTLARQDLDHVGSMAALARISGARVLAHELEAPFIDGTHRDGVDRCPAASAPAPAAA